MTDTPLERIFHAARSIEAPKKRAAFLDGACGTDLDLRRRVEALLKADAAAEPDFLAPPTPRAPSGEKAGDRIGPYLLMQVIGEGGFGTVWLAEQAAPIQRQVALKILKLGMDTHQVLARFDQERLALSMMDHPNIARALDAGATETGRPYFVMDLVRGSPIVEYCDKNNLTVEDRLVLFQQVCHAIQHAHSKGILHRDIKPSNVLVTTQDGRPQVKIIDFGIAKAMSARLTDKTIFTEQQQVIGTLQYMSPEQAEGSLDIDTRTDIYSLGVVLYELLTGSTPFDKRTIERAVHSDLQRMIREVEPPKPSTRLHESQELLPTLAAHRRIEPRRLGAIVRGELDCIAMKALEKDPSRRYATANAFALDVGRYLAGEPVVAAPPSASYRMRKFVARNRGAVFAAGAVVAALAIGVVLFAWQARVAQRERDIAVAARLAEAEARGRADRAAEAEAVQRKAAETNERKAEAINQFLLDMLGSANIRTLGREAKVAQALDRAATTVGTAFRDRPEVEAAIRQILGRTYLSLGMLERAEPEIDAALDLNRGLHGEASHEYASCLREVAELKQQRGDHAGAVVTFEKVLATLRARSDTQASILTAIQIEHANCLVQLHRESEAEPLLREALEARRKAVPQDQTQVQIAINSLAVLMHRLERLDEAEPLYREALALGERELGAEHPDTITARTNLASFLRSRGKTQEALRLMSAAYKSTKHVFGDAHVKTATVAHLLAQMQMARGRYQEALPLLEEGIAVRTRVEGERSAAVADAKLDLAQTLTILGNVKRARDELRGAVETLTAVLGAEHRNTLGARMDLANALTRTNEKEEAESRLKVLLEACPRVLGDDDPLTIIANNSYGLLLREQQRYADAEPFIEKALEIGRRVQGADHKNTIVTLLNLSALERDLGRLEEAESLGKDGLERVLRVLGSTHPYAAQAHSAYGETLLRLGRKAEGEAELETAIAVRKAATGEQNPMFHNDALTLARSRLEAGRVADAEPLVREVIETYTKVRGSNSRQVAAARIELARCLWLQGKHSEAEPLLLASTELLVGELPATKREVQRARRSLADFYANWNGTQPTAERAAKAAEWKTVADAEK